METPYITHLTTDDYEHVYEPAEDTFLMLDAIESDLEYLKNLNPLLCLEIGSGSGCNITALSNTLKYSHCLATDINPYATKTTKKTAEKNMANVDVICMDLVNLIKPCSIDVLIFNPPYVPTDTKDDDETLQDLDKNLIKSWAGGVDGVEIINKLLVNLNNVLSNNGVLYLLLIKENKPYEIINKLKLKNFNSLIIMERKIRGEHLFVLKINRKN